MSLGVSGLVANSGIVSTKPKLSPSQIRQMRFEQQREDSFQKSKATPKEERTAGDWINVVMGTLKKVFEPVVMDKQKETIPKGNI